MLNFLLGAFIGFIIGFFACAIVSVGARADERIEAMLRERERGVSNER